MFDDPIIRSHDRIWGQILKVVTDMYHSLSPVRVWVPLGLEAAPLVVAKGADRVWWWSNTHEMGSAVRDPRIEFFGMESQIAL